MSHPYHATPREEAKCLTCQREVQEKKREDEVGPGRPDGSMLGRTGDTQSPVAADEQPPTPLTMRAEYECLMREYTSSPFALATGAEVDALRARVEELERWLRHFLPKKETGPWTHGMGCPAEDDGRNGPCTCGIWADIDAARKALGEDK